MMSPEVHSSSIVPVWLEELCHGQPEAAALLLPDNDDSGHYHTLREILQQPATWLDTCDRLIGGTAQLKEQLSGVQSLVLSGSGSSQFAGECVRPALQKELEIGVHAIDGGALLTHGPAALPPRRPSLVVSLARSGNSPESVGAVSVLVDADPQVRHLVITCNPDGALAKAHRENDRLGAVVLDPRTNDRSLVMTSSFTNLVLAARFLGRLNEADRYRTVCGILAETCRDLLLRYLGTLARVARMEFDRVVYLSSSPDLGSSHECSLKMLEMTAGRIATMSETYLGLRHGPMSFVNSRTLLVCFLSSDAHLREYELDLIRELNRKKLGLMKLLVGERIENSLLLATDQAIEIQGLHQLGDDDAPVLQVVVGQLLAFFRCLADGLKPDSPSEDGVISRVVEEFPIHRRGGRSR